MFNRVFRKSAAVLALLLAVSGGALAKEKVILDTDMVESFDDGMAMLMLAKSDEIELLGVTITFGNTWVSEGIAYALRQLEAVKMEWKIPVLKGIDQTTRAGRQIALQHEIKTFGSGFDGYWGAFSKTDPGDWRSVYQKAYGREPKCAPMDGHAVNFIIESVRRNPGEVTIVEIGAPCNLAAALRMAPDIAPLVKRVIYMGGTFFVPGNTTPRAEFNWWCDPEAVRTCVRAPFKEQIIIPLDACNHMPYDAPKLAELIGLTKNEIIHSMLQAKYDYVYGSGKALFDLFMWDLIAAAVCIDNSLITESVTAHVDVDTSFGPGYGSPRAFITGVPPVGTQKAKIVTNVDTARIWKMIDSLCASL